MKNEIKSLPRYDVNSIRLRTFLDLVGKHFSQRQVAETIEELPENLKHICRDRESLQWVQTSDEQQIIDFFIKKYEDLDLLKEAGFESLQTVLGFLMPSLPKKTTITDVLFRIPSSVALFMTHCVTHLRPTSEDNKNHLLIIEPVENFKITIYDLVYLYGVLKSLFAFFHVINVNFQLTQTVIDSTAVQKNNMNDFFENTQFSSDITSIFIDMSRASYDKQEIVKYMRLKTGRNDADLPDPDDPEAIDTYETYVNQVIQRAAALLKDNRDLETAVEYLNIANDELEKQIKSNKKELRMARNIQKGFVPSRIPDWNGLQFWVKFYPLTEVSGDFYDFFNLSREKLGLLICDVSGHGVPAALISAIAKLSFNAHRYDSPSEVFSKVNLDLLNFVKQEGYLTANYLIIDKDYNIVYSVGAAPRPLLLRARTNEVERLPGTGTLLGMFPDANELYIDQMTHLEPGDKLFIFTDGLTEATNVEDEDLGEERIVKSIKETKGMNVEESSNHVIERYHEFLLGSDAHDDLTLITLMLSDRVKEYENLMSRGKKFYKKHQYQDACQSLLQAHEIFPRNTVNLLLLGRYLARAGNYQEAQHYLKQYLVLKPYNANAHTLMGYCYYRLGNTMKAKDELKRSLSLKTENPSALYHLVKVYLEEDLFDEAVNTFAALDYIRPNHPVVYRLKKKYFPDFLQ